MAFLVLFLNLFFGGVVEFLGRVSFEDYYPRSIAFDNFLVLSGQVYDPYRALEGSVVLDPGLKMRVRHTFEGNLLSLVQSGGLFYVTVYIPKGSYFPDCRSTT